MTSEQAYINGFVKRAAEYGFNEDEALQLYKKAFLGEPAYKEVPELSEEEVKGMRFRDMENFVEPEEGEGLMAHLKRNPGKYLGGALGGFLGGGMGDVLGNMPLEGAVAGGSLGAAAGAIPDALLNAARRVSRRGEAEKHLSNLQRHIDMQRNLNSDGQTVYNRHSLGF